MFKNVFSAIGNVALIGGLGLAAFGLTQSGERAEFLVTGLSIALFGFAFSRTGKRLGRVVMSGGDTLESGLPGTALITGMAETGMTVNEQPVFEYRMKVSPDTGGSYDATVKQLTPRMVAGAVLPGSTVAVKISQDDTSQVVIDWSQGVEQTAAEGVSEEEAIAAAIEAGRRAGGSTGESLESLLTSGKRGSGVIVAAKDVGEIGDLGLDRGDLELADDRLYLIEVDVKVPGIAEYRIEYLQRVPDRLIGKVGPGSPVVVFASRDNPESEIAIDWDASFPA